MDNIDDIRRANPQAAKALRAIKTAVAPINKLRKDGVAKGASKLAAPHSGRYGKLPRGQRRMGALAALKIAFRA